MVKSFVLLFCGLILIFMGIQAFHIPSVIMANLSVVEKPLTNDQLYEPTLVIDRTLSISSNKEIVFALPSNASTGYSWRICNYAPSGPIQLKSYKYICEQTVVPMFGGIGKEQFTFITGHAGQRVYLSFIYVGPGQDGSQPVKTIRYVIDID